MSKLVSSFSSVEEETRFVSEAVTAYRQRTDEFNAKYKDILRACDEIRLALPDRAEYCFRPLPYKRALELKNLEHLGKYSVEEHLGYWRLRYGGNDYIRNPDGTPRKRVFVQTRRNADGDKVHVQAVRRDKEKQTVFLHILSELIRGGDVRTTADFPGHPNTWMTCSHLCGRSWCFNPSHLVREAHALNVSRQKCCYEICRHRIRCLRPVADVQAAILALEASYPPQEEEEEDDDEPHDIEDYDRKLRAQGFDPEKLAREARALGIDPPDSDFEDSSSDSAMSISD